MYYSTVVLLTIKFTQLYLQCINFSVSLRCKLVYYVGSSRLLYCVVESFNSLVLINTIYINRVKTLFNTFVPVRMKHICPGYIFFHWHSFEIYIFSQIFLCSLHIGFLFLYFNLVWVVLLFYVNPWCKRN